MVPEQKSVGLHGAWSIHGDKNKEWPAARIVFSKARNIVARYPEAEIELEGVDSADVSDPESEMAIILQETVEDLGRIKPEMTPDIAISDCRYWRFRGIPAFWYGPDGNDCSAANESVSIEDLMHVVRTHALAAAQYLIKGHTEERSTLSEKPKQFATQAPEIKSLPPMRVARVTASAKNFNDIDQVIGPLFDQLYINLTKAGVSVGTAALATFEVIELPGFESSATTVHRGSESTDAAWSKLRRWISKLGYRPAEVYREFYNVAEPNPRELWATELQQLVTRRR